MRSRDTTDESEGLLREVLGRLQEYEYSNNYGLIFIDARIEDYSYASWVLMIRFRHTHRTYAEIGHAPQEIRDDQVYTVSVAIQPGLALGRTTADMLTSELRGRLTEHMRDWEIRTSAQRAEQRNRQQQEAIRRNVRPEGGAGTATQVSLPPIQEVLPTWYTASSNRTASTDFASLRHVGQSISTMQYIDHSTYDYPVALTEETVKTLIETLLTNGLDLKISLDESDGEVTAEVEVRFNGKVIASDSDSIQL